MTTPVLHWFREDLRLRDNHALYEAAQRGPVLGVWILDTERKDLYSHPGAASRWWWHQALLALQKDMKGNLILAKGDPLSCLKKWIATHGIEAVYWNRIYDPRLYERDQQIAIALEKEGVKVHTFEGQLLWEPQSIYNQSGQPYQIFTAFYKKGCMKAAEPRAPFSSPRKVEWISSPSEALENFNLVTGQAWEKKLEHCWEVSEKAAEKQLNNFVLEHLSYYTEGRNRPDQGHISRLSPYLRTGQLSPFQVWYQISTAKAPNEARSDFLREIVWREFCYHLFYHAPDLPKEPWRKAFAQFPWKRNAVYIQLWQLGQTGIPIVDAGMRELWQTGFIHNRVRMIVASFLVKHLLQPWQVGADWFWDCLVDADLANNSANWQWVAGCGADAAPYFRIFNPILQSQKYDPEGIYIRRYVPEIASLSDREIHAPWKCSEKHLTSKGIILGKTYPKPIIDLDEGRQKALQAYQTLRKER